MTSGDWGSCSSIAIRKPQWLPASMCDETGESRLVVWRPSKRLAGHIPWDVDFAVPMICHRQSDGIRRFFPAGSYAFFLARAWSAGLAILSTRQKISDDKRSRYRFDWFLYQRARRLQQFIRRRFGSQAELKVKPSARSEKGEYQNGTKLSR